MYGLVAHKRAQSRTSSAALVSTDRIRLREIALKRATLIASAYGNCTANEIAGGDESVRKRVHELVRMGKLVFSGVRVCLLSKRLCKAYEVIN
jgi:hypothetical protein